MNGDETAVDCGGRSCPNACGVGKGCRNEYDCTSGVCNTDWLICDTPKPTSNPTQSPTDVPTESPTQASCYDNVLNGEETAADCGGGECDPCTAGKPCEDGLRDCLSKQCKQPDNTCAEPTTFFGFITSANGAVAIVFCVLACGIAMMLLRQRFIKRFAWAVRVVKWTTIGNILFSAVDFGADLLALEELSTSLKNIAVVVLFGSVALNALVTARVLRRESRNEHLDTTVAKELGTVLPLIVLLACTNLSVLSVMPWRRSDYGGFPTARLNYLSLLSLFTENVPQMILQVVNVRDNERLTGMALISVAMSVTSVVVKLLQKVFEECTGGQQVDAMHSVLPTPTVRHEASVRQLETSLALARERSVRFHQNEKSTKHDKDGALARVAALEKQLQAREKQLQAERLQHAVCLLAKERELQKQRAIGEVAVHVPGQVANVQLATARRAEVGSSGLATVGQAADVPDPPSAEGPAKMVTS